MSRVSTATILPLPDADMPPPHATGALLSALASRFVGRTFRHEHGRIVATVSDARAIDEMRAFAAGFVSAIAPTSPSDRLRTIDEVAHETADAMMTELPVGHRVAAVIVGELLGPSRVRTVWRFVHCTDPETQAAALREVADLIVTTARAGGN